MSTHCMYIILAVANQKELPTPDMGVSSQPVSQSLKDQLREAGQEDRNSSSYGCLWSKVVAGGMKHKASRVLMKRRPRVTQGSRRRGAMGIKTRIRTLKRLIPRKNSRESVGLEGLFRDTADYILSLQTRVRVMQIMVDVLTASDE